MESHQLRWIIHSPMDNTLQTDNDLLIINSLSLMKSGLDGRIERWCYHLEHGDHNNMDSCWYPLLYVIRRWHLKLFIGLRPFLLRVDLSVQTS